MTWDHAYQLFGIDLEGLALPQNMSKARAASRRMRIGRVSEARARKAVAIPGSPGRGRARGAEGGRGDPLPRSAEDLL